MQNFEDISRAFVKQGGAIQVQNADELVEAIEMVLSDPDKAAELGRNAVSVVRQNLGAIERTVEMLVEALEGTDVYVAPWLDEAAASANPANRLQKNSSAL